MKTISREEFLDLVINIIGSAELISSEAETIDKYGYHKQLTQIHCDECYNSYGIKEYLKKIELYKLNYCQNCGASLSFDEFGIEDFSDFHQLMEDLLHEKLGISIENEG